MTNDRETADGSGEFNPYEPTDAATDPKAPATNQEDRSTDPDAPRIAASPPPGEPTIGRWLKNLPVVFKRLAGTVGCAWVLVLLGVLLALGATVVAIPLVFPPEVVLGEGTDATFFSTLEIPASGAQAFILAGFLGIFRPLRRVAFEGKEAIPTAGGATSLSLQRFWPTVTLMFGVLVGLHAFSLGIEAIAQSLGLGMDVGYLAWIVTLSFSRPRFIWCRRPTGHCGASSTGVSPSSERTRDISSVRTFSSGFSPCASLSSRRSWVSCNGRSPP